MTNSKNTKRALLASVLSVLLCVAMLIGSTFAWFTDSVTSGKNQIVAGNLDVELEYTTDFNEWKTVEDATDLFKKDALWEPGHAEVVYLRMRNAGTLALKYKFGMNIVSETDATNVNGDKFKLSQYLQYGVVESQNEAFANRDEAIKAVQNPTSLADYSKEGTMLAKAEPQYLALVVYMPETVGNEANYRGDVVPTIDLGLNLLATQTPHESDSFDDQYDKEAGYDRAPILEAEGYQPVTSDVIDKTNLGKLYLPQDTVISSTTSDRLGDLEIDLNDKTLLPAWTTALGGDFTLRNGTYKMQKSFGALDIRPSSEKSEILIENVHFINEYVPDTFYGPVKDYVSEGLKANLNNNNGQKIVIRDCVFDNANLNFAGMNNSSAAEIVIENCTFNLKSPDRAVMLGSNSYLKGSTITIKNCTVNVAVPRENYDYKIISVDFPQYVTSVEEGNTVNITVDPSLNN